MINNWILNYYNLKLNQLLITEDLVAGQFFLKINGFVNISFVFDVHLLKSVFGFKKFDFILTIYSLVSFW